MAAVLAACSHQTGSLSDFNKEVYVPEYASGFKILGSEGKESVIIETVNPWQGADSVVTRLFIARNGERVPDGFQGQAIESEAKRIVTMSSTQIAMLDAIGEEGRVVGVSGIDFISNPKIRRRYGSSINDVGYDSNVNYELLLSLEPDLVMLYGTNSASPLESKLRELGVPYVYIGEYLEESPLGKAEWMVAVSEIVGKRTEGEKTFSGIPFRYKQIKKLVESDRRMTLPKVMINTPYADSWFMAPSGGYLARLIKDAGGEYVYKENNSGRSVPIDMEEAYLLTAGADKWINVGQYRKIDDIKKNILKFADVMPILNGEVYNATRRVTPKGGNDYWETGVVQPDVVLRDMVKIFHPDLVKEDFVYYEKLK